MIRTKKMGFVTRKIRNQALKLFKRIENNDNPNWFGNGERIFLSSFLRGRPAGSEIIIFDCGAHQGTWADCCIRELGNQRYSLHLFEPSRSSCEVLRKRFESNPHVIVNPVGVSDSESERTLYSDEKGSSLSSLYQRRISEQEILRQEETVKLVRLDSYIREKRIAHIDLLKLDVEGHELSALAGLGPFLSSRNVDAIQFEYGGANLDSASRLSDFYVLLTDLGFAIHKVMRSHIEPRDYSTLMENFMYANYVALARP